MFRNIARIVPIVIPALTLAACGPSREDELERQLADAKASAEQEASARQQAERDAASARLKANDAELAKFYQGDSGSAEPEAETPPPLPADTAPSSPGTPANRTQADGRPIGDEMPAPQ